jgi:hypothetical protein
VEDAASLIRAVASLAWPLVALAAILLFRAQIIGLFSSGVRRVKAGPVEVEWDRQVSEIEAEIEQPGVPPPHSLPGGPVADELRAVAQQAPGAAVMEAYAVLERTIRAILHRARIEAEPDVRIGAVGLARVAVQADLITEETLRAVEGVAVLRNLAAHGHASEVTPERALDYLALIDAILFALRRSGSNHASD